jgi:hypothetical protein
LGSYSPVLSGSFVATTVLESVDITGFDTSAISLSSLGLCPLVPLQNSAFTGIFYFRYLSLNFVSFEGSPNGVPVDAEGCSGLRVWLCVIVIAIRFLNCYRYIDNYGFGFCESACRQDIISGEGWRLDQQSL